MKVTKTQKKAIKQLATIFPKMVLKNKYGAPEAHVYSQLGSEAIAAGTTKLDDGTEIDPKKSYKAYTTGTKSVNHQNRMEATFGLSGRKGVEAYGQKLLKPEHYAEWSTVVKNLFDYEEFGIVNPIYKPEPQLVDIEGADIQAAEDIDVG